MEIGCDEAVASSSKSATGEPSRSSNTVNQDGNKIVPRQYNEYPVFTYKPFVFHPIASLIKGEVRFMDYVKTVGRCCSKSFDDLYLEDVLQQVPAKIHLNFDCTDAVPKIGANAEVFGCVQYEGSKGNLPVFQVWFFRVCCGNVTGYIKTLLQMRQVLGK